MANAYEIIMDSRKELVNSIIENMKKGYIWSPHAWDPSALRPYNPTSDCYYLGGNRVRLMMVAIQNNYSDPRWCTFEQAKKNGWAVQRGAKSVLLEKWIFTEKKTIEDPNGNKMQVEETLEKPKVYYFRVFNAAQVHGMPKLEPQHDPDLDKTIETMLKSSQCPIAEVANSEAFYSPKLDKVTVPPRFSFKSPEAFLSVVTHEMSHSTGHPDRLNRSLKNKFGEPDYAREELRAELGSALLKCDLQLPLSPEQLQDHSNYLTSWIKVLQNDPNEFFRACRDAEKISDYLLKNYEKTREQELTLEAHQEAAAEAEPAPVDEKNDVPAAETNFDMSLQDYKEQVKAEIAQEAASAGMTVEEYAANGYEPYTTPEQDTAQAATRPQEPVEPKSPADTLESAKTPQTIITSSVEPSKVLRIVAELRDSNYKPEMTLVRNIYSLCQHTGKELTLRELAAMAKCPPADPTSKELIAEIANECCRQEMQIQAMNKVAVELT